MKHYKLIGYLLTSFMLIITACGGINSSLNQTTGGEDEDLSGVFADGVTRVLIAPGTVA